MAETVEASKADDVNLVKKDLGEMFELISSFNAIKTSMNSSQGFNHLSASIMCGLPQYREP